MGDTFHPLTSRNIDRAHYQLRTLGASPRVQGRVCTHADEHVDTTWGKDGLYDPARILWLVGLQYTGILLASILPGSTALQPHPNRRSSHTVWDCGKFSRADLVRTLCGTDMDNVRASLQTWVPDTLSHVFPDRS